MADAIAVDVFRSNVLALLDECFVKVEGAFLDGGTSMFETLATVSAGEASRPVGGGCASIAAQVNHTRFYLDVALQYAKNEAKGPFDWDGSWQVGPVDEAAWREQVENLRASYETIRAFIEASQSWVDDAVGGTIAMIAHSAYHLGEIRQALCVIKGNRTKAA